MDELNGGFVSHLQMSCWGITKDHLLRLSDVLKKQKGLTVVDVSSNGFGHEGFECLMSVLTTSGCCRQLCFLNIRDNYIGRRGCVKLSLHLSNMDMMRWLTHLDISYNNVEDVTELGECLCGNNVLKRLDMMCNGLYNGALEPICNALLSSECSLTHLDVSSNQLGWKDAKSLEQVLRINHRLQHIDIGINQLCQEGAMHLASGLLSNAHRVTYLNVSYCHLGDDGVKALAHSLRNNTTVTELDISCNNGVLGAQAMSDAIKVNETLQVLKMFTYTDTKNIAAALVEGLQYNGTIISCCLQDEVESVAKLCARNTKMKHLAQQSTLTLLALRRMRKTVLSTSAKEVIQMIAKFLWATKSDIQSWIGWS